MITIQRLVTSSTIYIYIVIISIGLYITDSLSLYKYDIDIDHIEHPKVTELFDYGTVRVTKFNRTTFVVVGYVDLLMDLGDDLWEIFEIYAFTANEYRKILERRTKQLCNFFQHDQVVIAKLINSTSMRPRIETCPVKAQRIHFYNTKMPTDNVPMEPSLFMKAMVKISIFREDRMLSNLSAYISFTRVHETYFDRI